MMEKKIYYRGNYIDNSFAMKNSLIFLFYCLSFVFPSFFAWGEFYEYVDENGVKTYTDSQAGIPPSRADAVQIHKEPYDDLPEEERRRMIEAEAIRIEENRRRQAEEREKYREDKRLRDLEKEEAEKKKAMAVKTTPVIINSDNQILVPVSLGYKGKTVQAHLLLDTGANTTTIHDNIAEQLGISGGRRGSLIVAGGDKIKARQLAIDSIAVGPKTVVDPWIFVLTFTGQKASFDGLLGLDFLRRFKYHIDFEKSAIVWVE